jgi:uncharacterized repeat protein (TIGR02543 family)
MRSRDDPATRRSAGLGGARLRLAVMTILAAASLGIGHGTARPAAATDCVTYACANFSVHMSGNGFAHVVDDQGEIDCYYNGGGTPIGTCSVQYYWIEQMYPNGELPVWVTATPRDDSFVCDLKIDQCSGVGSSRSAGVYLGRDGLGSVSFSITLGKAFTMTVSATGDGDGRVTTNPVGIDCHVAAGVGSGTCSHTWYFKDSFPYSYTLNPSPGDYACDWARGSYAPCGAVDQTLPTNAVPIVTSQSQSLSVSFRKGHPIVTAGVSGQGSVVSSPTGINCPSSCSSYFAPNTNVTLNAAAKAGYQFTGWSGACSAYGATCNLALGSTDVSTTATFTKIATPAPTAYATPVPTAHATPMPTNRLGITPAPTVTLRSTPAPTNLGSPATSGPGDSVAPSSNPLTGDTPTAPSANESDASSGATASGQPAVALGGGAGPSPAPPSAQANAPSTGVDPTVLLLLVVIAVLTVALGFALGTRRRRTST